MISFFVKRVFISILIVFIVSVFAFSLMHILPGDPARLVLGDEASQEDVDALRAKMNLDKPILEQYSLWISGIFKGDFGHSIIYERPVKDIILEKMPRTVAIGIPALIISVILGICFGIISAIKRGKWIDQVITIGATIGTGTPTFWVGIMLIFVFAVNLDLLPIQGFTSPTKDFAKYVKYAILPVVSIAIHMIAGLARQTRSNMLEIINQDYIRTARANGIPERSVLFRHALKNSMIPIITIIGFQVRVIIGGSVMVEQIFNIAGIGLLMRVSVQTRDYLMVQACVLIICIFTVAVNLLVDILYGLVNPRVRKSWG